MHSLKISYKLRFSHLSFIIMTWICVGYPNHYLYIHGIIAHQKKPNLMDMTIISPSRLVSSESNKHAKPHITDCSPKNTKVIRTSYNFVYIHGDMISFTIFTFCLQTHQL